METPSAEDEELPADLKAKFDKCIGDPLFKRTSQKLVESVYNTFQRSGPLEKSKCCLPSDVDSTFGTKTWKLRTQDGKVKIESTTGSFEHKETDNCDVLLCCPYVSSDGKTLKFCLPEWPPYILISLVAEQLAYPFFMSINSSGFSGPYPLLRMSDIRCLECSASEKCISCYITALPCTTADEVECFFRYLIPRLPEAVPLPASAATVSTKPDGQEDEQPRLRNRMMEDLKNERASREAAEAQYRQIVQMIGSAHYAVPKKVDSQVNTDPDPTAAEAKELRKEVKRLNEQLRQANNGCAEAERRRQDAEKGHHHAITELAAFRNAYQDLTNKCHDLDEHITHLKAVNKEQKNKLRAFEAAHQTTHEKKVCCAQSKSDGSKKRSRQTLLDPMQMELERIRRHNDELKASERRLQTQNSDLERSLAAESRRVSELVHKVEGTQRKYDELVAAANKQKDVTIHKVEVLQQDNAKMAEMLAKASARAEQRGALQEQLRRAQATNEELQEELRQSVQRATSARVRAVLLEKELEGNNKAVPDLECKVTQLENELKRSAQRASASQVQAALLSKEAEERGNQLEEANRVIEQLQSSIALAEPQQRATSAEVRAILLESAHRKEMENAKQLAEHLQAKLLARNELIAELSIKLRGMSGAMGDSTKQGQNDPTETPV